MNTRELLEALSWALDLLDMYDARPELVAAAADPVHVWAKQRARNALATAAHPAASSDSVETAERIVREAAAIVCGWCKNSPVTRCEDGIWTHRFALPAGDDVFDCKASALHEHLHRERCQRESDLTNSAAAPLLERIRSSQSFGEACREVFGEVDALRTALDKCRDALSRLADEAHAGNDHHYVIAALGAANDALEPSRIRAARAGDGSGKGAK